MEEKDLTTLLLEKMQAEQDQFKGWLLKQSPEEILRNTYQYTVKEDILFSFDALELTDEQARALLSSPAPLDDVYKEFLTRETGYMDILRDCVEERAKVVIREREALKSLPIYKYPGAYAHEHGELEQYRASRNANIACKKAIETAIRDHYRDNRLSLEAVHQVAEQFGFDRTMYVLANTVRQKGHDGRISRDNKAWAATIPVFENMDSFGHDRNLEFVVNSHPGLTDLFATLARREHLLTLPLSKEDIHHEAARVLGRLQEAREPNSPSGTHFMAQVSPDFLARATTKDQDKLAAMLPFASLSLSAVKGRDGVYAMISKDENRNQPLRRGRTSVRSKLQQQQSTTPKPPAPGKKKAQER